MTKKTVKSTKTNSTSKIPAKFQWDSLPPDLQAQVKSTVLNGLSEAILGFSPGGIGTQLTQVDTLFKNMRWYLVSNMRQVLSEAYVEHGLINTIVTVPVDDALRGGVEITSQQLSPEDIKQLQIEIDRENILGIVAESEYWNRLFGGAGILTLTEQDADQPLDLASIGPDDQLEFRAIDMWELFYDKQNVEGFNPAIQEPEFDFYNYYGMKVHKSRVMKLKGLQAPSFIRPRLRGWGFSIIEMLLNSINQYFKHNNLVFEVLDEFKIDIFKIKGLNQSALSAAGQANIQKRVQLANQQKNFQNAISMDAEDDYMQKQLSFSGLAEVIKEIRIQIACDMRMPMAKIFGLSASGFASGEDDIENYNGMVESTVRSRIKPAILHILELKCQHRFGMIPDDLEITFKPLRVLGAEQEENIKNAQHARLLATKQAGLMTTKEFKDGCNKNNLLSIQLDTTIDVLDVQPGASDLDQEGANKEPSQDMHKNSIQNPGHVNEAKWEEAKTSCIKEYGVIKWPVVMEIYKKMGGA